MVVFVGRLHLFELEDLAACPRLFRDTSTDLLQLVARLSGAYTEVVPLLERLLESVGAQRILDLCSGGAGPWPQLLPLLEARRGAPVEVVLSDKFPNLEAFERVKQRSGGSIDFVAESVDATAAPAELGRVRTIFTAAHHFRPEGVRQILADAVEQRAAIGVFEENERSVRACGVFLGIPLAVWALTPLLPRWSWRRALWTYALPLYPCGMLWDGMVSNLRAYSVAELEAVLEPLKVPDYRWEVGQLRGGFARPTVTYLLGTPS